MVPYIDIQDLTNKVKSQQQMLSWKEQVQKKFEKEVWEHKQREIAERQREVRKKTKDVKRDLQ
jgi:hypothetical protein